MLLVLAACALVAGAENIGIVAFRRDLRFDRQFSLLSLPRLLQVAVTIPAALLLHSYLALLAGIVTARLARTAMTYAVHPFRPRLRLSGWRALAGFSFWTWVSALAGLVWDRGDTFVLGPLLGAGGLGLYVQTLELASLPASELVIPATDALFAGFASAQRQGERSVAAAPEAALTLLSLLLPVVIAISCGAGDVVAVLLGPHWAAAQGLVAILAWQGVFAPFGFVAGAALVANGLVRRNFLANLLAAAIKLGALVIAVSLTRRLEVVAWVTVGCVAAEAAVFLWLLPGALAWRRLARVLLAGGSAVLVLDWLGLAWRGPGRSAVAHGLAVGVVTLLVYGVVLLVLQQGRLGRCPKPRQGALPPGPPPGTRPWTHSRSSELDREWVQGRVPGGGPGGSAPWRGLGQRPNLPC